MHHDIPANAMVHRGMGTIMRLKARGNEGRHSADRIQVMEWVHLHFMLEQNVRLLVVALLKHPHACERERVREVSLLCKTPTHA